MSSMWLLLKVSISTSAATSLHFTSPRIFFLKISKVHVKPRKRKPKALFFSSASRQHAGHRKPSVPSNTTLRRTQVIHMNSYHVSKSYNSSFPCAFCPSTAWPINAFAVMSFPAYFRYSSKSEWCGSKRHRSDTSRSSSKTKCGNSNKGRPATD